MLFSRFTFNRGQLMPDDERGPGPTTIELAIGAWQRTRAALDADDMLTQDELTVTLGPDLQKTETDVDTILRRMVRAMLYASLREAEAAELEKSMQARKLSYKARGELLRRDLLDILVVTQRNSFVAPEGTLSLRALQRTVIITDEQAVPDEYVDINIVRVLNKHDIYDDLSEGVVIPGAELSNGGQTLAFRRQRATAAAAVANPED